MSSLRGLAVAVLTLLIAGCGAASPNSAQPPASGSPAAEPRITLHLAGDSTMGEGLPDRRPETGWGEFLQPLFREDRVTVSNQAKRGRSTRSFLSEGFWNTLIGGVKEGDYVLIQFGHNDGSIDEEQTPPGEYRANLNRFVSEVRARRATALLATPIVVRGFNADGSLRDAHGPYPDYVRSVARENAVPLLDMQTISGQVVIEYGRDGSKALFQHLAPGEHSNYPGGLADNIHLSPTGARVLAERAVAGLRDLKLPLAAFLR